MWIYCCIVSRNFFNPRGTLIITIIPWLEVWLNQPGTNNTTKKSLINIGMMTLISLRSNIVMHISITIITLDMNTNYVGACAILFIIKHSHHSIISNIVSHLSNKFSFPSIFQKSKYYQQTQILEQAVTSTENQQEYQQSNIYKQVPSTTHSWIYHRQKWMVKIMLRS